MKASTSRQADLPPRPRTSSFNGRSGHHPIHMSRAARRSLSIYQQESLRVQRLYGSHTILVRSQTLASPPRQQQERPASPALLSKTFGSLRNLFTRRKSLSSNPNETDHGAAVSKEQSNSNSNSLGVRRETVVKPAKLKRSVSAGRIADHVAAAPPQTNTLRPALRRAGSSASVPRSVRWDASVETRAEREQTAIPPQNHPRRMVLQETTV